MSGTPMFGREKGKNEREETETAQTATSSTKENKSPAPLAEIREYASTKEISERIEQEINDIKSALGQTLRDLDERRSATEKIERLHNAVAKATGKKLPREDSNEIDVNGLIIILDASPFHELAAIETVVRDHQQRLLSLQKAREKLGSLEQLSDTGDLRYSVLEREGIPEQIMLRM